MSSSKGKGKAKAPAGSSKQGVASQPKEAAEPRSAKLKIVGDLSIKEVWHPQGKRLIEEPFETENNPDWVTEIKDREEFDAEYSHYEELWDKAGCPALLGQTFGEIKESGDLTQCISLGLGNFARKVLVPVEGKKLTGDTKPRKEGNRIRVLEPTLHQLMFLQRLVEFLKISEAKVFFQDPGFTKFEEGYLKDCFHKGCILNAYVGVDRPSEAQVKLTPETFLMAPMVSMHLSEVMQPAHKVPGLYVGDRMTKMIEAKGLNLEPVADAKMKEPFRRYRDDSFSKSMPRFIDKFEWPNECEIRSSKPWK